MGASSWLSMCHLSFSCGNPARPQPGENTESYIIIISYYYYKLFYTSGLEKHTDVNHHISFQFVQITDCNSFLAELWQPEGWSINPYRKAKETHRLIFSWLSWLVGMYACKHDGGNSDGDYDGVTRDGIHAPAHKLTETCNLGL